MGVRWTKQVARAALVGLLIFAAVGARAQSSKPLSGATPAGDPALVRQKDLKELLTQAREELLFNHNPQAAKEKCEQALAIDPNNPEAHFFLAQAERQLKGDALLESRSPVSALPDPSKMSEAVARSRPTTTTVVLPSDRARMTTTTAAGTVVRRAVVDNQDNYAAPRPAPVWLEPRYLVWAAAALGGVVVIAVGGMALKRLVPKKRRRVAAAAAADEEPPPEAVFELPEGASALGAGTDDDFPIGRASRAVAATVAAAPPVAASGEAEVDYWQDRTKKSKGSAPVTAMVEGAEPAEEEEAAISAKKIFGHAITGEENLEPLVLEGVSQSPPAAKVAPPAASAIPPRPAPTAPPAPQQPKEPLLNDLEISTPAIKDYEESPIDLQSATGGRAVLPEEEEEVPSGRRGVEAIPFSLDVPLDQTQTQAGEDREPSAGLDVLNVSEPEDMATIRLDEDFPLNSSAAPTAPLESAEDTQAQLEKASDTVHDEILISAGLRKPAGAGAAAGGGEVNNESTMVDEQARHKAIFQDQLARGMAAMEKQNWKDAVKYLSVAHAMNPDDAYCRDKLREARERQQ